MLLADLKSTLVTVVDQAVGILKGEGVPNSEEFNRICDHVKQESHMLSCCFLFKSVHDFKI